MHYQIIYINYCLLEIKIKSSLSFNENIIRYLTDPFNYIYIICNATHESQITRSNE